MRGGIHRGVERALALDPLSALKHAALGWGCYFARRDERRVAGCRQGIELEPSNVVAHPWLAMGLEAVRRMLRHRMTLR